MTAEQLAQLALSLQDNEAWQMALTAIRTNALEALAGINAADTHGILKHQATVQVVDDLRFGIDRLVLSGRAKKPAGLA